MTRFARNLCIAFILALFVASPLFANQASALDVVFVELFWLYDREEGTPITNPFGMDMIVGGSGVESVQVVTPGTAGTFDLTNTFGQEWEIPGTVTSLFNSSVDLFNAFPSGTYTFTITGTGGAPVDAVSRTFTITEVSDFLDVSAPSGGTPFPPDGTVSWASCASCDGTLIYGSIDSDSDSGDIDEFSDTDKTRTTWKPSGLSSGSQYYLEMILANYEAFRQAETTDTQSDPFTLTAGFENINVIVFTTSGFVPSVPSLSGKGMAALVALLALAGVSWTLTHRQEARERG